MMPGATMIPPNVAIGPIDCRIRPFRSLRRSNGESEDDGDEVAAKANGMWPLRLSGIGTTQDSVMVGWAEMACSIAPVAMLVILHE